MRLPKDATGTGHRGFAFAEYKDPRSALYAIVLFDGLQFGGRPLRVNEAGAGRGAAAQPVNPTLNALRELAMNPNAWDGDLPRDAGDGFGHFGERRERHRSPSRSPSRRRRASRSCSRSSRGRRRSRSWSPRERRRARRSTSHERYRSYDPVHEGRAEVDRASWGLSRDDWDRSGRGRSPEPRRDERSRYSDYYDRASDREYEYRSDTRSYRYRDGRR